MMGSMMRRAMIGDGSTLSLDFTTGQLDPRLTFTRASTGTFINASGNVATASNNVARFDHDPTTLAPRGLLIEGTATNLALRSNDFNTTVTDGTQWIVSGYTRGDVSTTLPDGTTGNACRISGTGSASFRTPSIAVTASTAYTFSFWARNNGGSQARYRVWNATAGSSIVDYTLPGSNYVAQIGGSNNTSTTWVRVSVTFTTPVGCTSIFVYPTSSDTGTVDLLLWGAQVEAGSGASSYIPTGASQVQRLGDSCVMTGANFSSWFAGATEGVLYAELERPRSQSGSIGHDHAAVGTRYSSGAGWILYATVADFWPTTLLWPTGGPIFPGGFPTSIPLVSKQAARWFGGNDATNFANGLQGTTGAGSGTLTPTMLSIGANSTSGTQADRDWLNACVRRVKFWPVALPNSQIIALTT